MKITKKQPLRPRGRSEDKRQSTKNVIRDAYIMRKSVLPRSVQVLFLRRLHWKTIRPTAGSSYPRTAMCRR